MHRICLSLPTNRPCADTIAAVIAEARYAVEHFDVHVCVLVLDSSESGARDQHAEVVAGALTTPGIEVVHLSEGEQRVFLEQVIRRSGVGKRDLMLELLLPAGVSYGACTNRAFLIAGALGCESVHRRDSDSRYQTAGGEPVYPVHHELLALGRPASEAAEVVSENVLDPVHAHQPVVLVGGSFIGEMSVDVGEIHDLDPAVYHDVVSLWAPGSASDEEKRLLVAESFKGAGTEPFRADDSRLAIVDPMTVDMCNIAFYRVHEEVPLPPAVDTIGSDYFLLHLVQSARLPGVRHNRDIVNFYTPHRRTGPGFLAYQFRLVKFFLSMLYLHDVYDRMREAGSSLLDGPNGVDATAIAGIVRESLGADRSENVRRLRELDRAYRRLGGKYEALADALAERRDLLLAEAQADMADFALLIETWGPLVRASRTMRVERSGPGGEDR